MKVLAVAFLFFLLFEKNTLLWVDYDSLYVFLEAGERTLAWPLDLADVGVALLLSVPEAMAFLLF